MMAASLGSVTPVPRLRILRGSLYDSLEGSSSIKREATLPMPELQQPGKDGDESAETPRITPATMLLESAETPAARLRALLARVPVQPRSSPVPRVRSRSPSEIESDFDLPTEIPPETSSVARESLKDLFSRALRDPGSTPQRGKGNKRRNSIDLSEVDSTPRRLKGKNKPKRKSFSDDELDSPAKVRHSGVTSTSSRAATFDTLRERLRESYLQGKSQDLDVEPGHDDNRKSLWDSASSLGANVPHSSLSLSAVPPLQFQSNLLDHDPEMQREIEGLNSYEDEDPNTSLASPYTQDIPSETAHPHLRTSSKLQSKSSALSQARGSNSAKKSAGESHSVSSSTSSQADPLIDDNHLRDREQGWNRRKSLAQLDKRHDHPKLSRPRSIGQLRSFEDKLDNDSVIHEEHRHPEDAIKSPSVARQREWNKNSPNRPRPASSLGFRSPRLTDEVQKDRLSVPDHSHIVQPSSPFGHRPHTSPTSSRPSSPAGSTQEDSKYNDLVHERERNWDAPHPKWTRGGYSPPSRIPASLSKSSSFSSGHSGSRLRTESLHSKPGSDPTEKEHSVRSSSSTAINGTRLRKLSAPVSEKSALTSVSSRRSTFGQLHEVHKSPVSQNSPNASFGSATSSTPNAKHFSRNRSSLPPFKLEHDDVSEPPIPPPFEAVAPSDVGLEDGGEEGSFTVPDFQDDITANGHASRAYSPSHAESWNDSASRNHIANHAPSIRTISPSPPDVFRPRSRALSNSPSHESPTLEEPSIKPTILSSPPPVSLGLNQKFRTPSPPKGLRELPDPSPLSEGDDGQGGPTDSVTLSTRRNFSTIQTPRPPGGWSSPFLPQHGGYVEPEVLVTPASPSRASFPAVTPAPPGAWMTTPATAKKPTLKVRFESQTSHEESPVLSEGYSEPSNGRILVRTETMPVSPQLSEMEPSTKSPSSPSRKSGRTPRKSPSIRVLDAFGREQPPENEKAAAKNSLSKGKGGIRVLDAYGREQEDTSNTINTSYPNAPLTRNDALLRLRAGLSDLAQDLDDIDRTSHDAPEDARLRELHGASQTARQQRGWLAQALSSAEAGFSSKSRPLKMGISDGSADSSAASYRFSRFYLALIVQLLVAILLYRVAMMRAEDLFINTYYDPFYAELHLYTSKPDTLRDGKILSRTSWLSIPEIFSSDGWKASAGRIRDNVLIGIDGWQRQLWAKWGEGVRNVPWPPT